MIPDPTKILDKAGAILDDNFESEEERQKTLTERLQIDNTSPFKLPHLIRPISTIFSGILWGLSIIWTLIIATILISKVGIKEASNMILSSDSIIMYVLGATTTTYATHIGFYFNSRKAEKINAKKAFAAIAIEKEKSKVAIAREELELKLERKEARQERKDAKKAKKNQ